MAQTATPLDKFRAICMALPQVHEKLAHGSPTWRTTKRMFAMYAHPDTHHGAGRHAAWLYAQPHNQELMIAADPERFFSPPYVGCYGWIGIYLDRRVSWRLVRDVVSDAYLASQAPKPKAPRRK